MKGSVLHESLGLIFLRGTFFKYGCVFIRGTFVLIRIRLYFGADLLSLIFKKLSLIFHLRTPLPHFFL